MTGIHEKEATENRIKAALENLVGSDNCLVDSMEELPILHDGHEIELALMGIPETVDGELRDWAYFTEKLRGIYIDNMTDLLDFIESEYRGVE